MRSRNSDTIRPIETPTRASDGGVPAVDHRIEMLRVGEVAPATRNARKHSKKQIRQIADAIGRFRYMNPLVVDEHGKVIAGHGRLAAAKLLGIARVPVIRLDHLSEVEVRALMLADNRNRRERRLGPRAARDRVRRARGRPARDRARSQHHRLRARAG